ncbi:MFS transporter [Micromonospora sp. DR5-3]|uniref:MFS transporter n=1 Tax=unclassified Micromonospora TaxID=2617518 RepID=UPI001CA36E46|nr:MULTISPECIES: MFS transporter [unclassified Micromonospora]MCW3819848.1 MFS transporter [Micromonospora sp. DR5-3]
MTTTQVQPILNRPMVLLLLASFGGLTNFFLLLSVVPLYAGGSDAGDVGAGLATGAMMLSTVLLELAAPKLLARLGYRAVLALGLLLLAAPSLLLILSPAMELVVAVSLVRGAGFGIFVVTGGALVAELVPAERRGEGLGLYGVVCAIPAILGLPAGVWLSDHVAFSTIFTVTTVIGLVGLLAVPLLPPQTARVEEEHRVLRGMTGALARPTLIFTALAVASGVFATFLPLAVSAESRRLAALALLVQSGLVPLARWAAGWIADRHGAARLLIPAVLSAAMGTFCVVWLDSPLAVIAGMVLFGIGFGAGQNVTMVMLFERVKESEFGRASALWNFAYDAGLGIGAVGFGFVADLLGYPVGFALTAAVLLIAIAPAVRDRRHAQSSADNCATQEKDTQVRTA